MRQILFLLILNMAILSSYAQHVCGTEADIPYYVLNNTKTLSNNKYVIRVFVHVIRTSNGQGGASQQEVANMLNILVNDFAPHNICFSLLGIDDIWDDKYFYELDIDSGEEWDLFQINNISNAINIYLLPANTLFKLQGYLYPGMGKAAAIPSNAFFIGGSDASGTFLATTKVTSHEIGHCLGLYHTFHGTCDGSGCEELLNGSNCSTCGDLVCDTPADNTKHHLDANCNVYSNAKNCKQGNYLYPSPNNLIMDYIPPQCMQIFTPGQGERMRGVIATHPLLQSVIVPRDLTLANITVNPGETKNYDVTGNLTVHNLTVEPGASMTLRAGEKIHVKPSPNGALSSRSEYGSYFHAYIENTCSTIDIFNNARIGGNSLTSSVEKPKQPSFRFYPNPTTGISYVELPSATIYEISVRDLLGREILRKSNLQGKTELNLSGFPKGIYFLQVQTEQGEFFREKVLFE